MILLRIGNEVINLDLVTRVDLAAEALEWGDGGANPTIVPAVMFHFAGQYDDQVHLVGAERDAFLRWLRNASGALDLMPTGGDDRDFAEYLRKGGTLDRVAWDQRRGWLRSELSKPNPNIHRCSAIEAELLY